MNHQDRQKQIQEAEEILGDRPEEIGFAKGLFFGQHLGQPPAALSPARSRAANRRSAGRSCAILRARDRPRGDRPAGADSRQRGSRPGTTRRARGVPAADRAAAWRCRKTAYCRLLEVLGGHCGSTALFVNAHHSIGPRALVLFGTDEQQRRWLPKLATRRVDQRVRPDRARSRQRRGQRANDRHAHARRQRLRAQRRKSGGSPTAASPRCSR